MKLYLRFYTPHDVDLLHLKQQGISLSVFAKNALFAYAHGKDIKYLVPPTDGVKFYEYKVVRADVKISDKETIALLKSIQDYKLNVFVKQIMRNALVRQDLSSCFKSGTFVRRENEFLKSYDGQYERLIPHKRKALTLDDILRPELKRAPEKEEPFSEMKPEKKEITPVKEKSKPKTGSPVKSTVEPDIQPIEEPVKNPAAGDTDTNETADTIEISTEQDAIFDMFNGLSEDL
ncbi:hypothetical protein DW920_13275 [Clostridium sp. AM42-36]|nr:hypothetical protein DW920_13275 [Clostridium sp. AM42-36]RHU83031.1 hypothetical protein DXC24_13070 [Clostridium sp. OM08-29]